MWLKSDQSCELTLNFLVRGRTIVSSLLHLLICAGCSSDQPQILVVKTFSLCPKTQEILHQPCLLINNVFIHIKFRLLFIMMNFLWVSSFLLQIEKAEYSCPPWFPVGAKTLIHKILDPNPETVSIGFSQQELQGTAIDCQF